MGLKKYEYYCETEEKLKSIWTNVEPTHCYENTDHIINISSIVIANETEDEFSPDDVSLNAQKARKIITVDIKTVELINNGFAFDSKQFSLSEKAQINWILIKTLENLLSFPINITTKDDDQYTLSEANLNLFIGAGVAVKQHHLDSGRALKLQIVAAENLAALELIVDNR